MIKLPKTEEYLKQIIDKNFIDGHDFNVGYKLSNVSGNIVHVTWETLFDEHMIEIVIDTVSGSQFIDAYFISNGGFSTMAHLDDIELSDGCNLPPEYETNLFDIFVREFLHNNFDRCPISIFKDIPQKFLDIMFEEYYIMSEYTNDELINFYETTKNEKFLPPDVVDIFLF